MYIYKKFSLLGGREEFRTPPAKNLLLLPPLPPHQVFIPSPQKFNSTQIKLKTLLLAVVIAPVPILF